jgi:hypothetical protein
MRLHFLRIFQGVITSVTQRQQVGDEDQSFYICLEAMYSIHIDRLTIP